MKGFKLIVTESLMKGFKLIVIESLGVKIKRF